ncbi:hypothetical protein BDK51DRAFT_23313 [Blyttiomyces helicus]|uniref:Reverse transcriptase Ty1/copia-type domain-containing protein n=1 Tax=Blyttiomyces helicus TaxID=388810 RepID=A0A4P9WG65_9FUNG|nr:hypothetical protein BDK51DRAFT_23313 [Blyttiomyces helicus]|eukprot:RKO91789.1 hypothetical protein BDK51DRAFT_23313 [Blyttiomyces helicus]
MEQLNCILGIKADKTLTGWFCNQAGYIDSILECYNISKCNPITTPLATLANNLNEVNSTPH